MSKPTIDEVFTGVIILLLSFCIAAIAAFVYEEGRATEIRTECMLHGGVPVAADDEILCIDRRVLIDLRPPMLMDIEP